MKKPKEIRLTRTAAIDLIMYSAVEALAEGKRFRHAAEECKGKLSGMRTSLFYFGAKKQATLVGEMWKELHEFKPEVTA